MAVRRFVQLQRLKQILFPKHASETFDSVLGLTWPSLQPGQVASQKELPSSFFVRQIAIKQLEVALPALRGVEFPSDSSVGSSYESKKSDALFTIAAPDDQPDLARTKEQLLLSTYLAMVDEVTTAALFESDVKRGHWGVSVALNAQFQAPKSPTSCVDIEANVEKLGQNLAFLKAMVRDSDTSSVLCRATHIKYVRSSGWVGWVRDWAFCDVGWKLLVWWFNLGVSSDGKSESEDCKTSGNYASDASMQRATLQEVLANVSYHQRGNDGRRTRATFSASSSAVSNGLNMVHGGLQAILVELVARRHLQEAFGAEKDWFLESLHVEFMSSASLPSELELEACGDDTGDLSNVAGNVAVQVAVSSPRCKVSTASCLFVLANNNK